MPTHLARPVSRFTERARLWGSEEPHLGHRDHLVRCDDDVIENPNVEQRESLLQSSRDQLIRVGR